MAGNGEHPALRNRSHDPAPCYPRNADGLTYGSGLQATRPDNEPDLIQVTATNGMTGYVYRADITPSEPASPQEAAARSATGQGPRTVLVYRQDGTSVIGEFVLAASAPGRTRSH
jgi:hypothetical protein